MKMRITSPKPIAPIGGVTPTQDPELVAAQERDRLGISIREQLSWRNGYEAFGKWREALEGLNIVVLQEKMPVEEVRGFSLLNDSLPAIVVSTSDSIRARAFSLFHEYAHLVLGTSGICIPSEAWHHDAEGQTTEKFCNHFAGAFLVPAHALREDEDGRLIAGQPEVDDTCVDRIAGRFKVSRQVVLRRMLITGVISSQQYSRKLEEWLSRVTGRAPSFGVPPPRRCILENGRLFVSLALEARERGLINYSDLSDYLSINLKHLDRVEALLHR
jgi:Zn-dependent peptidase ImmA (M78 family)